MTHPDKLVGIYGLLVMPNADIESREAFAYER
jgi:hypothetical protein